jgi:hypothetical protein
VSDGPRWLRWVLVALTATLLIAAGVAAYARAELVDSERFSQRAVAALDDAAVRQVVATKVVDGLANAAPDVLTVRPVLEAAVAALADTPLFRRAVLVAMADAHRQLLGGSSSYVVALEPSTPVVGDALRSVAPRIAAALPPDLRVEVAEVSPGDSVLRGARGAADLAAWTWPLLGAALLAALALVAVSGSKDAALAGIGASILAAGLTVGVAVSALGIAIVAGASDEQHREARRALWTAMAGDLRTSGFVVALAGGVVLGSAFGGSIAHSLELAARRILRAPLARAAALAVVGCLLLVAPGAVAQLAAGAAGVMLIFAAAAQLRPARATHTQFARSHVRARPFIAFSVAVPVAAAVGVLWLVLPAPDAPPRSVSPAGGCNGSRALCDKRLSDVVFPSTHNSYSAADEPGWLFANQRFGIARQLEDGIRGLLIDVHTGVPDARTGRVRTDLRAEGMDRNKVVRALSSRGMRTADALAGRVGAPLEGPRRTYLCHTLCELGAEPLRDELRAIRAFLDRSRGEVVVLFIEPYVPVAHIERAMSDADLLDETAELQRDEPLPTLGELIRAGTRLVVLSEEDGGSRPWYLPGFSFAQDTPLGARNGGELRCRRYRGDAESPLLLLNHWIDTFPPAPTRNERIGSNVLRDRVDRCGRERGLLPNLLAVDFYERTDVVQIAARRNAAGR